MSLTTPPTRRGLTKTRLLSLLVLVLAALNVGLLAVLWLGRPTRPAGAAGPAPPLAASLIEELRLSPPQQQQFAALRTDHHARLQALLRELGEERHQLFAGLARCEPAPPARLARIGDLQRQIDSLTYAHFAAVGRLLTPAQRPAWQRLAPDLPRRLQPQGPPPGRRPGGPPPFPAGPPPPDGPPPFD